MPGAAPRRVRSRVLISGRFRALAYVEGHRCRLVSRRGHTFAKWDLLCEEIAHSVKTMRAVLDGELVCLGDDRRALFHRLLYRRDWPSFFAFDLLEVDGEALRDQPLSVRKRRLPRIVPRHDSRLLYGPTIRRWLAGVNCSRPAAAALGGR